MSMLNIEPNIADMDAFYEQLIATHDGLTEQESHLVNAKLVLLLANHIGDLDVLKDALAKARGDHAMSPEAFDAAQRAR
jgi:predicted LPLAT superfamily acyltransferase